MKNPSIPLPEFRSARRFQMSPLRLPELLRPSPSGGWKGAGTVNASDNCRNSLFRSNKQIIYGTWFIVLALWFGAGCNAELLHEQGADDDSDQVDLLAYELNATTEDCDTLPPNRTLNGGGTFTTNRDYTHTRCFSAYLLNLNNYSPDYNGGTVVSYADTIPTTEPECTKLQTRVYVWRRNANGSTDHLGNAIANGRWHTDPWGEEYCEAPAVRVEDRVPEFVPGGNYRLGMRAHTRNDAGNVLRRQFHFETLTIQPPRRATDVVAEHQMLASRLSNLPTSAIDQTTSRLFSMRASGTLCRALDLHLSFFEFMYPTMTDLGASSQTIADYLGAERSAHNTLCNVPYPRSATILAFQSDLHRANTRLLSLVGQVSTSLGVPMHDAMTIVNRRLFDGLSRLSSRCDTNPGALADYIRLGTTPFGSAQQLLLGTCGSSPDEVRSELELSPQGRGTLALHQCLTNAVADLDKNCTNPVASGGGGYVGSQSNLDICESAIIGDCPGDECWEISDFCELRAKAEALVSHAARELAWTEVLSNQSREALVWHTATGWFFEIGTVGAAVAVLGEIPGAEKIAAAMTLLAKLTTHAVNLHESVLEWSEERFPDLKANLQAACKEAPYHPRCQRPDDRCPGFDFAGGDGWYESAPDFMGATQPLTYTDRIDYCMCEHFGESSKLCPSREDEREKQECLTNPAIGGPDDGPRPECIKYMQPEQVDRDAFLLELCKVLRPECGSAVFVTQADGCGCPGEPNISPDPVDLCRDVQNVIRCGQDPLASTNVRTCGCQPVDSGRSPFGGRPGCQLDISNAPGARDAWLTQRYSDVLIDRRYDISGPNGTSFRDVLMYQPGFTAAVSPALWRSNFTMLGDRLNVDVYLPAETPTSGYYGALQAYCSHGALNNHYLGQVELAELSGNRMQSVSFPLSARDRELCFNHDEEFRLTFAMNSDPAAPRTLGMAGFRFGGAPIAVQVPDPVCPDPTPDFAPPLPRTWTFPDGQTLTEEELTGRFR